MGLAFDAAAEVAHAVEVAAVDGGGAGRTLGGADRGRFAEAFLAEQLAAAVEFVRANITER